MPSRARFGDTWTRPQLCLALLCTALVGGGFGCGDDPAGQQDAGAQQDAEGQQDATSAPTCSPALPDGVCPEGRVCRGGACIVDLDPGTPIAADARDTAEWIWGLYDRRYGAFPATNVDWNGVHERLLADVSAATTQFELEWAIVSAVGELQDGHTYAQPAGWCARTGLFGSGKSNTGGCVVEVADRFFVYKVVPDNPMGLAIGDELVAIDGRRTEEAITDLEAQPRCWISTSTSVGLRSTLVASLMYRPAADRSMHVRRTDGSTADLPIQALPEGGLLACDGRIGIPDAVDRDHGVESAVLPGNVLYVRLPVFGYYDEQGNLVGEQTIIAAMSGLFAEAEASTGLILDLRANPGGYPNIYFRMADWLFPQPTALFSCRYKSGNGHDDFGNLETYSSQPDLSRQMTRPLAVLVSSRSYSCADFTPLWIHTTGRGKTFGEASNGSFGEAVGETSLPDWTLGYSDILCSDTAGNLLQGHPPAPDFPVTYTEADIVQGIDTVVESARAWVVAQ